MMPDARHCRLVLRGVRGEQEDVEGNYPQTIGLIPAFSSAFAVQREAPRWRPFRFSSGSRPAGATGWRCGYNGIPSQPRNYRSSAMPNGLSALDYIRGRTFDAAM
jgi:hypothetical protein